MNLQPRITTKTITDNLYYRKTLMLDVKIEYPELGGPVTAKAEQEFNKYYINDAKNLYKYARTKLYSQAAEAYRYSKSHDYPFNHYTLFRDLNVTYNDKYMVSLYFDTYEYTGGAHGLTTRTGNTWSLEEPKLLKLSDLFPADYDYKSAIIEEVTRQAEEKQAGGDDIYFDNLQQNIANYFDPENFYLTADGLAIFYPLYSLAPYAAGIQVFIIPYDILNMKMDL